MTHPLVRRTLGALGLALVWVLLWGDASPGTVVAGLGAAVLAMLALRLPLMPTPLRISPVGLLRIVARFAVDVVRSSAIVAWEAVGRGPRVPTAVVAVPLRTDSDLVTAFVSNSLSLIPGALVVRLDRERGEVLLHLLPSRDDDLERARRLVDQTVRDVRAALRVRDDVVTPRPPAAREITEAPLHDRPTEGT